MAHWDWSDRRNRRIINNPEYVVGEILKDDFLCPKEKVLKPMTRYQIAKQTGLSWPTINRAMKGAGFRYSKNTKQRLKKLLQPIA